jgi:DNA repair protein REV1
MEEPERDSNVGYSKLDEYVAVEQGECQHRQAESLMQHSSIFKGVVIYVDGRTDPPQHVLKDLIIRHDGRFEQHYTSTVTHMVAMTLPNTKIEKLGRKEMIVRPEWITDCIKVSRLLPTDEYQLYSGAPCDSKQLVLAPLSAPKTATEESDEKDKFINNDFDLDPDFGFDSNSPPDKDDAKQKEMIVDINDPRFLKSYFGSSRLHHLSAWRQELKVFAQTLMQGKSISRREDERKRVIMHVDMDCFFASVGLRDRPFLKDRPVAITHAAGRGIGGITASESSSDLASCNYIAREYGLHNGMLISRALRMCPELVLLPYEFAKYQDVAYILYRVLAEHADEMQAVSCDEAYIDVTSRVQHINPLDYAAGIRKTIEERCGCNASIGISSNMLLARLATKKAKPNNQWQLNDDQVEEFMQSLKLADLPGVGWSLSQRLAEHGWSTCGNLYSVSSITLQKIFGPKIGKTLFEQARGHDMRLLEEKPRQSVGADVNWAVRFQEVSQAHNFINRLAQHVFDKLEAIGMMGKKLQLKILKREAGVGEPMKRLGCGNCDAYSRSRSIPGGITSARILQVECIKLYDSMNLPVREVRGVGIFVTELSKETNSLGKRQSSIKQMLENGPVDPMDAVIKRYGYDRNTFKELPEDIRMEILNEASGSFEQRQTPSIRKHVSNVPKKQRRIDQMFPIKREADLELPKGVDKEFLDAIPMEIRHELMQQYRVVKETVNTEQGDE